MAKRITNKIMDTIPFSEREKILAEREKNRGKETQLSDFCQEET